MEWLITSVEESTAILLAGLLGAVLGAERELAGKPAGLRTHIFVCAGSALFMILGHSILNAFEARHWEKALSADPMRIVQAIVVGISFLGAGTIFRNGDDIVEGLTTAASILFTSGIGVAVALERYDLAVTGTVFALGVLLLLLRMEEWLESLRHHYKGFVTSREKNEE